MNKFKNLLPQALLLSYVIKMLLISATMSDVGIVFALSSLFGLKIFLDKKQEIQEIKAIVDSKLEEQKAMVNKAAEVIQVIAIEHAKMKSIVEALKMKNDFSNGNGLKKVI